METETNNMLSLISYLYDNGYHKSKTLWGVAYAVKHPLACGISVTEAARHLGCTRQSLHSYIRKFEKVTGHDGSDMTSDFADLDKTTN